MLKIENSELRLFVAQLSYTFWSLAMAVIALILMGNSSPGNYAWNTILIIFTLSTFVPFTIKAVRPESEFNTNLERFMRLPKEPTGFNYPNVMEFIGSAGGISFCFTAAIYVIAGVDPQGWGWLYAGAIGLLILVLLMFAGMTIVRLVWLTIGVPKLQLCNFLAGSALAAVGFSVLIIFLQVGLLAGSEMAKVIIKP